MSIGKFFGGFVVGGLVGGIIGVILAPRSGEETRQMLADNSTELYRNTEESVRELQGKANVIMEDLQRKGDELLSKVQDALPKK